MNIPNNLDEAIDTLLKICGPEETKYICDPASESYMAHHSMGQSIRNTWELWKGNGPLTAWFIQHHGIRHADDISGAILFGLWQQVRGEPVDITSYITKTKAHWIINGVDPLES